MKFFEFFLRTRIVREIGHFQMTVTYHSLISIIFFSPRAVESEKKNTIGQKKKSKFVSGSVKLGTFDLKRLPQMIIHEQNTTKTRIIF